MNSMMASSKRFLVCESDYQRLCRAGSEEYLIEFRLVQGSDTGAFATAYADAGLPMNGPAITAGLIRMMNALSDGVMILLILLVSLLVFLISAVCIRFVLLTRVEKEKREIGMMKALGMDRREMRQPGSCLEICSAKSCAAWHCSLSGQMDSGLPATGCRSCLSSRHFR